MQPLFVVGLCFDAVGAMLIAWPVIYPGREGDEEGKPRWGGNPWVYVLRLKERRYVQFGAISLFLGFLCQFVAYAWHSGALGWYLMLLAAIGVIAFAVGSRLVNRGMPTYRQRPPSNEIEDWRHVFNVPSRADALSFFEIATRTRHGRAVETDDRTGLARINHGRWLARCPRCNNDTMAFPESREAFCIDDGVIFSIALPPEKSEIEQVLLVREKSDNRNWSPGETLDQLRAENTQHGLPADG